jgi:hypothetical protein
VLNSLFSAAVLAAAEPPVDVTLEASMSCQRSHRPELALDGKPDTWFWSRRAPQTNDDFTVVFARPVAVRRMVVTTGTPAGEDSLAEGLLEVSADGVGFETVAKFRGGKAESAAPLAAVKTLRIRPTAPGTSRLALAEIRCDMDAPLGKVAVPSRILLDVSEVPDLADWGARARDLCAEWYPKLAALLHSDGFQPPYRVRLRFSKDMRGVAATGGSDITVAANYVRKATNDFGMVIHELVHVVQSYPSARAGCVKPGWLVEGIADYIRLFHFEPEARRPRINPDKASYRDSYKTTAIFLDWVERTHHRGLVNKLNAPLRARAFKLELFQELTGKTVDELWQEFAESLRSGR